jgi:hypothetical protein
MNDRSVFIHQALKEGNKLSQVYISKRKVTGTHLINGILYAIQNRFLISFTHTRSFGIWKSVLQGKTNSHKGIGTPLVPCCSR